VHAERTLQAALKSTIKQNMVAKGDIWGEKIVPLQPNNIKDDE